MPGEAAPHSSGTHRRTSPMVTAEQMAEARGVKVGSIRSAVYRASKAAGRAGGTWPAGQIPRPDRYGKGHELRWDPRRRDVREYMSGGGTPYPQLGEPEWLASQYPARGASAIAADLGCAEGTVYAALDRAGIPVRPGQSRPPVLDLIPLESLEGALTELGTIVAVAARYGVGEETIRRALRRKRAAQRHLDNGE